MDNTELLAQIQQMMTGLETRMTEKIEASIRESEARMTQKVDNLEARMTEKIETSIQESEARMTQKIEESEKRVKRELIAYIDQNNAALKDYIDQNNVVIGEMMTKALERVTAAIELRDARFSALEQVVQKNLYDIEVLKADVFKLKQQGA